MIEKILILVCGLGLVYSGIKVIVTGKLFVKGIYSDFSRFNIPVGIIFIIVGAIFIVFLLWKKKETK